MNNDIKRAQASKPNNGFDSNAAGVRAVEQMKRGKRNAQIKRNAGWMATGAAIAALGAGYLGFQMNGTINSLKHDLDVSRNDAKTQVESAQKFNKDLSTGLPGQVGAEAVKDVVVSFDDMGKPRVSFGFNKAETDFVCKDIQTDGKTVGANLDCRASVKANVPAPQGK